MSTSHHPAVVIAGAGPVGLFLACELALAQVDVLVLERDARADAPLKHAPLGTRGLSIATAEALHRRGLLDALLARPGVRIAGPAQAGHFAGIDLDPTKIDAARWPYRLAGTANGLLAADMASVEAVLAARAADLGVEVRRGEPVTALGTWPDHVLVRTGDKTLRTGWLVGCDGGRSAVRKLAGFDFPGTEPEFTAYSALVDFADPQALPTGRHATPTGFFLNESGRIAIADFDGGAFDRSAPVTREHLQAVLRRVSGTGVTVSAVHQATTFTDRARQAASYRRGRVLLAGDAAHVHSALGGQGLNAGLGDAMNLGWKLAATVRGTAPAGLLDTYEAERHPVGEWVLDWSRAQAALMRPGASARALEGVLRGLVATVDGATTLAAQLWGVALRYDLGGMHPLVGRSAPDFEFDDGRRLAEALRDGRGLLVDFEGAFAGASGDRIVHVARHARDELGLAALLVRPDGFVAWACDGGTTPHPGEARAAVDHWFGVPA
jgi:2-polyprenyl-6-methoxyphenol hydroxylase-like FAD-dependent oxidoreductase